MNDLAIASSLPVPAPRRDVSLRIATMADVPFLDSLQKQHSKALGYFPTKQFEGYIEMGGVLVAWASSPCSSSEMQDTGRMPVPQPLGYVISRDRYLKRDELGVIYQLCVAPGHQRSLVGASLVKSVFERSAYGCKLYCCWCAQDLAANHFWESMGFVPIAFRAGSTGKRRVHIFWQRRIDSDRRSEVGGGGSEREDGSFTDPRPTTHHPRVAPTPYWYPCQTNSGAIREDRLVFPIPPGTHWTEVQAVALPSTALTAPREAKPRRAKAPGALQPPPSRPSAGRQYGPPSAGPIVEETLKPEPKAPKRERVTKPKVKIDPVLAGKARQLRDWWMEQANDHLLIAPSGKYDVSRQLDQKSPMVRQVPLLKAG